MKSAPTPIICSCGKSTPKRALNPN